MKVIVPNSIPVGPSLFDTTSNLVENSTKIFKIVKVHLIVPINNMKYILTIISWGKPCRIKIKLHATVFDDYCDLHVSVVYIINIYIYYVLL